MPGEPPTASRSADAAFGSVLAAWAITVVAEPNNPPSRPPRQLDPLLLTLPITRNRQSVASAATAAASAHTPGPGSTVTMPLADALPLLGAAKDPSLARPPVDAVLVQQSQLREELATHARPAASRPQSSTCTRAGWAGPETKGAPSSPGNTAEPQLRLPWRSCGEQRGSVTPME
jgi:hypothetical protein